MLKGEYPKLTIETKYGKFVVKYPTGKDFDLIARLRAESLNGLPYASFDRTAQGRYNIDSTLQVVIADYPADFAEVWQKDGIIDFPDQEVKNFIFKKFDTFCNETQDSITKES